MDQGTIVNIIQRALTTVIMASAPMLIIALAVGLIISIFQATTQIQEQTLAFIPKILAVFAALVFFGAWILRVLVEFATGLYTDINGFIR
ncbi:MAG: flagellar biosynthesis protein FliQ [Oscillospiraceae bacterium]|nr:flagellar biosynthesis protein FliQ [Oscillospiraceae bacterium]